MVNSRVSEILHICTFCRINMELNFNILTPNWYQCKQLILFVNNNLDKFVNYRVLKSSASTT